MPFRYFPDTRTLHVVVRDAECASSVPVTEMVLVDFDADGEVIAVTIEGVDP